MQYIQLEGQIASNLDTPISGAYNLFVDTSDNLIKVKDENGNLIGGGAASIVEIQYDGLYQMFQSGSLTAGQYYVITDYQTFYDQPNWTADQEPITTGNYKSGSIVEPLVVLATSTSSLSPFAHSTLYPKDTIKYDISWNETEVTANPAKGRIYERIDEVGNRTDYDWREVRFKRYDGFRCDTFFNGKISVITPGGPSTGSVIGVDTNFDNDFSVGEVLGVYNRNNSRIGGFDFYEIVNISGSFYMDITGSYYSSINDTYYSRANFYSGISPFQTNTVSVYKDEYEYNTFHTEGTPAQNDWYNNYLGNYTEWDGNTFILSNNVFLSGDYRDNYFDSNVVGNTFDDDNYGNHCGRYFRYNCITDDFDSNKIGDNFEYNFIDCDFQENIIGNDFTYNMLGDDDGGVDFNQNIINSDSFDHNWSTGVDAFVHNIISNNFNTNIILNSFQSNLITGEVYNNFFDNDIENNHFKQTFNGNEIYDIFQNNVLNTFYDNIILQNFERNQISGQAYANTFSGSFFDNTIGNNFHNNTFEGIAAYNQIGSDFYNNVIGADFGVGYGNPRGNKIGNNFIDNNIGEYFYSNTISDNFISNTLGDYFQQNVVLANNVNGVNFNTFYGNVNTINIINANIGGSDGVYSGVESTNNGHGIGATFDVIVSSGEASVSINQSGVLYEVGDTLTVTGSLVGGGTDLIMTVDSVSATPVVFRDIDSTILKTQNGDLKLTYFATSGFGYVDINQPVD